MAQRPRDAAATFIAARRDLIGICADAAAVMREEDDVVAVARAR